MSKSKARLTGLFVIVFMLSIGGLLAEYSLGQVSHPRKHRLGSPYDHITTSMNIGEGYYLYFATGAISATGVTYIWSSNSTILELCDSTGCYIPSGASATGTFHQNLWQVTNVGATTTNSIFLQGNANLWASGALYASDGVWVPQNAPIGFDDATGTIYLSYDGTYLNASLDSGDAFTIQDSGAAFATMSTAGILAAGYIAASEGMYIDQSDFFSFDSPTDSIGLAFTGTYLEFTGSRLRFLGNTYGYLYGGDTASDDLYLRANSSDTGSTLTLLGDDDARLNVTAPNDILIQEGGNTFLSLNQSGSTYADDSTTGTGWVFDHNATSGTGTAILAPALTAGGTLLRLVGSGTGSIVSAIGGNVEMWTTGAATRTLVLTSDFNGRGTVIGYDVASPTVRTFVLSAGNTNDPTEHAFLCVGNTCYNGGTGIRLDGDAGIGAWLNAADENIIDISSEDVPAIPIYAGITIRQPGTENLMFFVDADDGNLYSSGTISAASATLTDGMTIAGGYGSTGVDILTSGDIYTNGNLIVDGIVTAATMTVTGNFDITGNFSASGTITSYTGTSTFYAASITTNVEIGGGYGATGVTIQSDGDIFTNGDIIADGMISGATATFSTGAFATLTVGGGYGLTGLTADSAGNVYMNGKLTVDGDIDPVNYFGSGFVAASGGFYIDQSDTLTLDTGTNTVTVSYDGTDLVFAGASGTISGLEVGGGYGSTGTTMENDGDIDTDGDIVANSFTGDGTGLTGIDLQSVLNADGSATDVLMDLNYSLTYSDPANVGIDIDYAHSAGSAALYISGAAMGLAAAVPAILIDYSSSFVSSDKAALWINQDNSGTNGNAIRIEQDGGNAGIHITGNTAAPAIDLRPFVDGSTGLQVVINNDDAVGRSYGVHLFSQDNLTQPLWVQGGSGFPSVEIYGIANSNHGLYLNWDDAGHIGNPIHIYNRGDEESLYFDTQRSGGIGVDIYGTDGNWAISASGTAQFATAEVGGGYGSTGLTAYPDGDLSINGDLTIDGDSGFASGVFSNGITVGGGYDAGSGVDITSTGDVFVNGELLVNSIIVDSAPGAIGTENHIYGGKDLTDELHLYANELSTAINAGPYIQVGGNMTFGIPNGQYYRFNEFGTQFFQLDPDSTFFGGDATTGIGWQFIHEDLTSGTGTFHVCNSLNSGTCNRIMVDSTVVTTGLALEVADHNGDTSLFSVDEDGDVLMAGTLGVSGESTLASGTVTSNLQIGGGYDGGTGIDLLTNGDVLISGKLTVDGNIDPVDIDYSGTLTGGDADVSDITVTATAACIIMLPVEGRKSGSNDPTSGIQDLLAFESFGLNDELWFNFIVPADYHSGGINVEPAIMSTVAEVDVESQWRVSYINYDHGDDASGAGDSVDSSDRGMNATQWGLVATATQILIPHVDLSGEYVSFKLIRTAIDTGAEANSPALLHLDLHYDCYKTNQ